MKPSRRARALHGHPWVFAGEVEQLLPPERDGETVVCRDPRGRSLGSGIYNSRSQIIWRRISWKPEELNEAFLRERIGRAIGRRQPEEARRLVWSESDDLPGLVVDQYGDVLTIQTLTLAMDRQLSSILSILREALSPREMVIRNDAAVRLREGLTQETYTASGNALDPWWQQIGGIEYRIDLTRGQKTGYYLDQRFEHHRVARLANGKRVLDAFCNQGGFALQCARGGAVSVLGVDISGEAVGQARENAIRNGVDAAFEEANVFDFLRQGDGADWDLIVLDPPPFAKSKGEMEGALRGYKEINLRAMKRLSPGGLLATYTCSHHMSHPVFLDLLGEAAADVKRRVRVIDFCHQPADHPVLPTMPESEYLRGFILEVE